MRILPSTETMLADLDGSQLRATCPQCGEKVYGISQYLMVCPPSTTVGAVMRRLRCKDHGCPPVRVALHQAPGPGGYRVVLLGERGPA